MNLLLQYFNRDPAKKPQNPLVDTRWRVVNKQQGVAKTRHLPFVSQSQIKSDNLRFNEVGFHSFISSHLSKLWIWLPSHSSNWKPWKKNRSGTMKSPSMIPCCTNLLLHNPLRQQWQRWERHTWHGVWSHLPLEILFFNRGHYMTQTPTNGLFFKNQGKSLTFCHIASSLIPPKWVP